MAQSTELRTYTRKERNMYLVGLTGQNIIYSIYSVVLSSYYLQNVLYIPSMALGVILALTRVWDGFNDPIMGTLVDRTNSKWGKCRPYLRIVPIPIALATILTFTNFTFNVDGGLFEGRNAVVLIWTVAACLLWDMIYTIGDIPLWGITALMTEDEKHRQKLMSAARIFGGVGGGIAMLSLQPLSLAAAKLFEGVGDIHRAEKYGFIFVAVIAAAISGIMFQMTGLFAKERISAPPQEKKNSIWDNFKLMWKNKPFRQLLLSGVLGSPKNAMVLVAMPIVTYYYSSKNPTLSVLYLLLLGGGLFAGQFTATALAPRLLEKYSKKNVYNFSNLMIIVPNIILFLVYLSAPDQMTQPIYLAISFVIFALNGISIGLSLVVQTYMIADAVDYEEYNSGRRPDGVFFSGQTFLAKINASISQIIYGIACSVVGFSDANIKALNEFVEKGEVLVRDAMMTTHPEYKSFMTMLFFMITIPAAIGSLLAVIPTWKYALDDKTHREMLAELNRRRHEGDDSAPELEG